VAVAVGCIAAKGIESTGTNTKGATCKLLVVKLANTSIHEPQHSSF